MAMASELLRAAALLALLFQCVAAHRFLLEPLSFNNPRDYSIPASQRDFDLADPLKPDGSNFPCKNYHLSNNTDHVAATYKAGQMYPMTLSGGSTHSGGSCQIALSYDHAKTWSVIKSIIGDCPLADTYYFTIPDEAPSGKAIFAWTWLNKIGNREFYMDCAPVEIVSNSQGNGLQTSSDLADLPSLCVANLRSINTCRTTEDVVPIYRNPGREVSFGKRQRGLGLEPPMDCDCESITGTGSEETRFPNSTISMALPLLSTTSAAFSLPAPLASGKPLVPSFLNSSHARTPTQPLNDISPQVSSKFASIVGVLLSAKPDFFHDVMITDHSPILPRQLQGPNVAVCPSFTTTTVTPSPTPAFLQRPCYADSIRCVSPRGYRFCTPRDSAWYYSDRVRLPSSSVCVPSQARCPDPNAPYCNSGFYRNDRIEPINPVTQGPAPGPLPTGQIPRPSYSVPSGGSADTNGVDRGDGTCYPDGSFLCTKNGYAHSKCDHGLWINMGPVAAGIRCRAGMFNFDN